MKIKRTVEIETDITASELATMFWSLTAEKQAEFFNKLYDEVEDYGIRMIDNLPFERQMLYVLASRKLTNKGRKMMDLFSNFKRSR